MMMQAIYIPKSQLYFKFYNFTDLYFNLFIIAIYKIKSRTTIVIISF